MGAIGMIPCGELTVSAADSPDAREGASTVKNAPIVENCHLLVMGCVKGLLNISTTY
jgi:hypothetical protein